MIWLKLKKSKRTNLRLWHTKTWIRKCGAKSSRIRKIVTRTGMNWRLKHPPICLPVALANQTSAHILNNKRVRQMSRWRHLSHVLSAASVGNARVIVFAHPLIKYPYYFLFFIFSCISIFTVLFLRESFWSFAVYTFFIFQTPFSSW